MFSNLTLYYLKQIGIRPWVTKVDTAHLWPPVVVFVAAEINDKALNLFKSIVHYIEEDSKKLRVIKVQEQDIINPKNSSWLISLEKKMPLAIVAVGENIKNLINTLNLSCSIICSPDLEYLLNNPLAKRQIFTELTELRNLIFLEQKSDS